MITDPIADMLTRIRNANINRTAQVKVSYSKMKKGIGDILLKEGFIASLKVEGGVKKEIAIGLKYAKDGTRVISGLKRISKPGLRSYASVDELPTVLNGLGIAIISTSKGLMTASEAKDNGLGGEVLAYVW